MAQSACIAGIGESAVVQVPDRSTLQLQTDAARAALADAGLTFEDIDGLITTPVRTEAWNMPCGVVASHMGVKPAYLSTLDLAGATGAAMIHHAAMAIGSGQCTTVLCVAGQNLLSARSRASAVRLLAESGAAHPQFESPYGPQDDPGRKYPDRVKPKEALINCHREEPAKATWRSRGAR